MPKKLFWIVIAVCVILLMLINSHSVEFFYLYGRQIELKLDLLLIVAFAAGILTVLISGFIGKSQQFFSDIFSYSVNKKQKRLKNTFDGAVNCIELGNYKKAKELLNDYLKEEVNNIDAYVYLSDIHLKEGNIEDAKEVLKKASFASKDDVNVLSKLSEIHAKSDEFLKAVKVLEKIKEISDDKAFYDKKIYKLYVQSKEYKKALELAGELEGEDASDELEQDFLITKYNYAQELIKSGKTQKAKKLLKEVIKKDKDFFGAYTDYAGILVKDGKPEEAVEFLSASYEETKFPYFVKLIEDVYMTREDPQQALSLYQRLLDEKEPGSQSILYALYVRFLLKLEMIDYAVQTLNDLIGSEGDKKVFHLFLAECYLRHQKYEDSSKQYHEYLIAKSPKIMPFKCNNCGAVSDEFTTACIKCGRYNTTNYSVE